MFTRRPFNLTHSLTGLCSLVLFGGLVASCAGSSNASTTMSPGALAALALKNATTARWVHEVDSATGSGHVLKMDNDIGTKDGRQVIDSDGARSTVLVLNGMAYISGDATALTQYFGLQISNPAGLAGRWISIRPIDQNYSAVSAAVTLKSDFANFIVGPFSKGPTAVIDGTNLTPLHGFVQRSTAATKDPATLYVTQIGTILPVRLQASNSGATETVTWSKWGHPVVLVRPTSSIPISTVLSGATA